MRQSQAQFAFIAMVLLSVVAVGIALWNRPESMGASSGIAGQVVDTAVVVVSRPSFGSSGDQPLAFRGTDVLTSGEAPEACLVF